MTAYLYLTAVITLLLFLIGASLYLIMMAYSLYHGAPYVASDLERLKTLFDQMHFKKGMRFIDLGCGDGRVVRLAANEYGMKGTGIDSNPALIWLARWRSKSTANNPVFICSDITNVDFSNAQIVYLFLFPKLILSLKQRLLSCQKGTCIISHGFRIPYLENNMIKEFTAKPFSTYLYQV